MINVSGKFRPTARVRTRTSPFRATDAGISTSLRVSGPPGAVLSHAFMLWSASGGKRDLGVCLPRQRSGQVTPSQAVSAGGPVALIWRDTHRSAEHGRATGAPHVLEILQDSPK